METALTLSVLPDIYAVSDEAAGIFIGDAERHISSQGFFTVAVSGGSTPIKMFNILGSESCADKVDWSKVHFFWVDERCVPKEHRDSNFKGVWGSLISHVPIPAANVHRIKGELPPEDGAGEYENELKQFFGAEIPQFDLIFLGMGEDGHTASLFPGSNSLNETKKLAVPVYVDKLRSWRVSLTLPVLNNGRRVVFLVTGKNKAGVLKEILQDGNEKYPAGLVKPDKGDLIWLVDEDAAGEIKPLSRK